MGPVSLLEARRSEGLQRSRRLASGSVSGEILRSRIKAGAFAALALLFAASGYAYFPNRDVVGEPIGYSVILSTNARVFLVNSTVRHVGSRSTLNVEIGTTSIAPQPFDLNIYLSRGTRASTCEPKPCLLANGATEFPNLPWRPIKESVHTATANITVDKMNVGWSDNGLEAQVELPSVENYVFPKGAPSASGMVFTYYEIKNGQLYDWTSVPPPEDSDAHFTFWSSDYATHAGVQRSNMASSAPLHVLNGCRRAF